MRRILITLAALALFALAVPAAASAHQRHTARDRNRDGLPDRWERQHHLSLKVNQAHRDPDRDGLDNRAEFEHGTDPRRADTDRNGVRDDNEVRPVGTIASFHRQNGMLTITLRNGQSVTGLVTPATRIECEDENEVENEQGDDLARAARDGGGDDNSGPRSNDDHQPSTTTATTPTSNSGPGSSNSGPGSVNSGPGNAEQGQRPPNQPGDRDDESCGPAALAPGTPVREAEARLTADGLVFEEIELGQAPATPMAAQ
jgi:hypothetical protein